ncbi:hypothetical protein C8R43DRAFT_403451 [Mycena crocata]|nr:hypothetical protein C8R43DRAFT_403451 [Mycena crocata]
MSPPALPLELEWEIFELVAIQDPRAIPTLMRVAKRVAQWLGPMLYKVIVFRELKRTALDLDAFQACNPELAARVQHVLLAASPYHPVKPEALDEFFGRSPGIVNLSIVGQLAGPALLPLLLRLRLQRLSIQVGPLFRDRGLSFVQVFRAVTHLDVRDSFVAQEDIDHDVEDLIDGSVRFIPSPEWLQILPYLPVLTHLGFNSIIQRDTLDQLLHILPRLQVLMVIFFVSKVRIAVWFAEAIATAQSLPDPRLVVAIYRDYFTDWESGARGHGDLWVRAEAFVGAKRRGENRERDLLFARVSYFLRE